MVLATETEEGARLREAHVKAITGGERIRARFMHQDFFEFAPTHKLILSTNHKPIVHGTDHAIWRRLLLVSFDVIFGSPEEVAAGRASRIKDTKLQQRLLGERKGVLAWLVEGCLEWQRGGLKPPASVRAATEAYRGEMDKLAQFIDERCSVGDKLRSSAAELSLPGSAT